MKKIASLAQAVSYGSVSKLLGILVLLAASGTLGGAGKQNENPEQHYLYQLESL